MQRRDAREALVGALLAWAIDDLLVGSGADALLRFDAQIMALAVALLALRPGPDRAWLYRGLAPSVLLLACAMVTTRPWWSAVRWIAVAWGVLDEVLRSPHRARIVDVRYAVVPPLVYAVEHLAVLRARRPAALSDPGVQVAIGGAMIAIMTLSLCITAVDRLCSRTAGYAPVETEEPAPRFAFDPS